MQCGDSFDFFVAAQYAAFELEVIEAVFLASRLRLAHDGLRSQRDLVAHAKPVVVCAGIACVTQVSLAAVAHVKQVAQHLHRIALLPFAEQGRHGHIQVLTQQVEQRRFNCSRCMDGGAQVKRLLAPAATVTISKLLLYLLQGTLVGANRLAHNQAARVFQRLPNLLAAWHLAHTRVACVVGQYQQIAREERAVSAA